MFRSVKKVMYPTPQPHRGGRCGQVLKNVFLGTVMRGWVAKKIFLCRSGHFMQSLIQSFCTLTPLKWSGGLANMTFL